MIYDAGEQIRESFSKELIIETKTDANDLVTNIDCQIEQFFVKKIKELDPSHKIMGEEGMGEKSSHLMARLDY